MSLGECVHCKALLHEVHRTDWYVFYACDCEPNASGWTRRTVLLEDGEFTLGSAGSLIWACDQCGEEHFRDVMHYTLPYSHKGEMCFTCQRPMQRVNVKDLDTKWRPLWRQLGFITQ